MFSTPLATWHCEHGARMVAFAGWSMPLHYLDGITREHIATRTRAGLFDVSHMGRFRITGPAAAPYLGRILTNDPRTLDVGTAHYTLFATETGGALDDAYLYRLGAEEFLLVVNAANRQGDWGRLLAEEDSAGVALTDASDALAMLALQGPQSATMLASLVGAGAMPETKRNRLRVASFAGAEIIIARTGYTGEAQCFELMLPAQHVLACWQALVDVGAVPAGLGARDSLRLEAGLPLYGHELGIDRDGREIPIFANALARFGVRRPGDGEYIGRAALDAQRAEFEALAIGAAPTSGGARLLTHLVRPLAVFDTRRPLRAGYEVYLAGEAVGYVTSGTSVPIGAEARALEMRPIGLALLRADIQYRQDHPIRLTVKDARGASMVAELVERNLPPAAHPHPPAA